MTVRRALLALVLSLPLAACAAHKAGEKPRFPTPSDYPPGTMDRQSVTAGVEGWRLSGLRRGRADAPWRLVIVTGTPSWSDFWAPTLAAAPADLEVVVVDRPGFGRSEPSTAVGSIETQAKALEPLLDVAPGRRVVLIGQSYGGPIATTMAARNPGKVKALVLVSAFFGVKGPTANTLTGVGAVAGWLLPRDLKNGLAEARGQGAQLPEVREALAGLTIPVVVVHGDRDSFVPFASAEALARDKGAAFVRVPGGDHFLNACCVTALLGAVDQARAEADRRETAAPAL